MRENTPKVYGIVLFKSKLMPSNEDKGKPIFC